MKLGKINPNFNWFYNEPLEKCIFLVEEMGWMTDSKVIVHINQKLLYYNYLFIARTHKQYIQLLKFFCIQKYFKIIFSKDGLFALC